MKRIIKYVLILIVLIGSYFTLSLFVGVSSEVALRKRFDHLVKTADHVKIAHAAVETIILINTNQLYDDSSPYALKMTNLPSVIAGLRPSYVSVETDEMRIEFHGGFDHFGFDIRKDEAKWDMSWYTEDGHHPILSIPIGQTNMTIKRVQ